MVREMEMIERERKEVSEQGEEKEERGWKERRRELGGKMQETVFPLDNGRMKRKRAKSKE